jgi:hypothetical protein
MLELVAVFNFGVFVAAKFGEVATRLSVRVCSGERGVERDLLSALRLGDWRDFGRSGGESDAGFFAASVKDLSVALITSVARTV